MTQDVEKFLEQLREVTRSGEIKWYLDEERRIRAHVDQGLCCPITGTNYKKNGKWIAICWTQQAADSLKILDWIPIFLSADNGHRHRRFDPELRSKLLEACGL